jgi:hypothetical protein
VSYRWLDEVGRPFRAHWPWPLRTRLPVDLRANEAIELPLAVRLPRVPGIYQLQLVVDQGSRTPFDLSGPGAQPVNVTIPRSPSG